MNSTYGLLFYFCIAFCIKNEGTTGRDTIYLAAPEDRAWSEGISRPGRCAHGDLVFKLNQTLRRAANAFGVKFGGKKWIPVQKFCVVPSDVIESFSERFKKAEYLWGISTKL